MLHVIHLVISLDCGGLERLVVDWTLSRNRRLPKSTQVVCLDQPGILADELSPETVIDLHADRSRFPWDRQAVCRLRNQIRSLRRLSGHPVIVHSHNPAAQFYAALSVYGTGALHVHTRHGPESVHTGWTGAIRRFLTRRGTHQWIAVSESTAQRIRTEEGLEREQIQVIANGIRCPEGFQLDAEQRRIKRAERGLAPDGLLVGTVGRLDAVKGQDRLWPMMAALRSGGYSGQLVVVGDGPMRARCVADVQRLNLGETVKLVGYQRDSGSWLELFDLFILPSRAEGLSLALLEALARRVPVAVTDVGANRMVLEEGRWGALLSDDESTWPQVVWTLLGQGARSELREQVAGGRERVRHDFSMERTLDEYESVYERCGDMRGCMVKHD